MKRLFLSVSLITSFVVNAQVGIGTTTPQATLDVRETNPASPTAFAGIAIPQVDNLPSGGNRAGQLVFLTTTKTYYYFDSSAWTPLGQQALTLGDVKYGFQGGDHSGWILLNGRAKSTLTTTQQAAATALGIGINLPNIQDKGLVGVSGSKTLNSTGGYSTTTIAQNQLPNVTLTTNTTGSHTHKAGDSKTINAAAMGVDETVLKATSDTHNTDSAGSHNHTILLNGGVTQESLNIQNPYIALNGFIYLGN